MFAPDSIAEDLVRPWKPGRRVLFIDGDQKALGDMEPAFRNYGYEFLIEPDAAAAVRRCRMDRPDVVVLDIWLEGMDGTALCKEIRECTAVPLVVFTAWTDPIDRVVCLKLGADVYLTKPLQTRVLLAHLDALIRRSNREATTAQSRSVIEVGPYQVNRLNRRVLYRGNPVHLATGEFELFWLLVNDYGNVVERPVLLQRLRMRESDGLSRALDGRALRLRRGLQDAGAPAASVKAVRSQGFMLTFEESAAEPMR